MSTEIPPAALRAAEAICEHEGLNPAIERNWCAALARIIAREMDGWQTMDTAPRDGTWILGLYTRGEHFEHYVMAWSKKSERWYGYLGTFPPKCLHWRHLEPPTM